MTTPEELTRAILKTHEQDLLSVVRKIHETPELSEKETRACTWQADLLKAWGFSVETGYKALPQPLMQQQAKTDPISALWLNMMPCPAWVTGAVIT